MKLAALAFVALLAASAQADDAAKADVFKDEKVGLEITKPEGWYYFGRERTLRPLVAFSKFREPYADLNPSFEVRVRPIVELKGKGAVDGLGAVVQAQRQALAARVAQEPTRVEVAGMEAAYARLDYTAELQDGREFPIAMQLWIVPVGQQFFMFDAGTRQDEKTGTRKEIEAILRSIRITPR